MNPTSAEGSARTVTSMSMVSSFDCSRASARRAELSSNTPWRRALRTLRDDIASATLAMRAGPADGIATERTLALANATSRDAPREIALETPEREDRQRHSRRGKHERSDVVPAHVVVDVVDAHDEREDRRGADQRRGQRQIARAPEAPESQEGKAERREGERQSQQECRAPVVLALRAGLGGCVSLRGRCGGSSASHVGPCALHFGLSRFEGRGVLVVARP